jgi:hypothetical protein
VSTDPSTEAMDIINPTTPRELVERVIRLTCTEHHQYGCALDKLVAEYEARTRAAHEPAPAVATERVTPRQCPVCFYTDQPSCERPECPTRASAVATERRDMECVWIPEFTKGRRVSTMFHRTDCGVTGAATFGSGQSKAWKFCPFCSRQLFVSKDPLRLRS